MDPAQMAALLLAGHGFYTQGRLGEAMRIFEGLALLDERNPYVQGILGSIYQKLGMNDAAVRRYTLALEVHPADIPSLTNRGELYLRMGRYQEAAADLQAAIDLDSEMKEPAGARARLLVTLTQETLRLAADEGIGAVLKVKAEIDLMGPGFEQSGAKP